MPTLDAYLFFDGNCADAMRFYERALGGKIEMMLTNAQAPAAAGAPAGNEDRIMHARLNLDGRFLMASDTMAGRPFQGMHGFSLSLIYGTAAEARRAFDALVEGGKVGMAFQETFWSEGFGMVTDRFGTPWMVNGGPKAVSG